MRRIGVATHNEIISGDVIVGGRIGNVIDEPYRSYDYDPQMFKKVSLGKKFNSFLMNGEILRYDRYSGRLRRTKDLPLHIPFGSVVFIYGIGGVVIPFLGIKLIDMLINKGMKFDRS